VPPAPPGDQQPLPGMQLQRVERLAAGGPPTAKRSSEHRIQPGRALRHVRGHEQHSLGPEAAAPGQRRFMRQDLVADG